MKKALTTFLIFSTLFTFAQQDPYYTHFKFNRSAYNPAAAGEHENNICIIGVTHYQWRQFSDVTTERGTDGIPQTSVDNVAPETHNVNLESKFGIGQNGTEFIGVGLSIIDDNVGFTKRTSILANLNYQHQFQGGFSELAGGIGIGFQQFGLKNPNFKWRDPNDPNIVNAPGSQGKFNMNAGVFYRQKRMGVFENFYAGISVTQLTAAYYNNIVAGNNAVFTRKFVPHYYALFGTDYPMMGGNLVLEPAILFKYSLVNSTYRPQVDLNATALYANTFRGGIAWRQFGNPDALSLLLGYKTGALEIGYSYDITVSAVQTVSAGTHEVMVKYCIPIQFVPPVEIIKLDPRHL